jgi:DNA-binding transcriptional regulator YdaS (Cro superfamily)
MQTHELINLLGGSTLVGRHLNIRPQAVSIWIAKKRIPAERVPSLVRLARERGISLGPEAFRSDIDWDALK